MKTRIVHTKFWKDSFVYKLSTNAKILFIYLLTCEDINISGIFELLDDEMMLCTKLTQEELHIAQNELSKAGKAFFYEGWVCLPNVDKYNNYKNSPKNVVAYEKELRLVPQKIHSFFDKRIADTVSIYTSINTSIDTPRNHKSGIRNQKSEIRNQKEDTSIDTSIKEEKKKTLHWIKTHHDEVIANLERLYPDKDAEKAYTAFIRANSAKNYKYADYLQALQNWVREDRFREYNKSGDINMRTGGVIAEKGKYDY